MVDLILWRRYGARGQALVGQTYRDNQNLAALGVILPVGTVIYLPDLARIPKHLAAAAVSVFE